MKSCPVCSYSNPDGVDFCLRCAVRLTLVCESCGHLLAPDSKFCSQCGTQVQPRNCRSCGASLLPNSKFCSQCGAPVPAASPTPSPAAGETQNSLASALPSHHQENLLDQFRTMVPAALAEKMSASADVQGERREVTVLFLDLMNFTAFSEQTDNEEIYLIVHEAMRLLAQIIYRYEGTIDKFTGDGLMALFGTPIAHENDPERAVRAALEMQQSLIPLQTRIREQYQFDFQARIGINTGLVIAGTLGSDLHMEYTVIGDTVNLASRLEKAADPGTVLVSFDTYQRTRPIFNYQALPPLQLKGVANPVVAYRPLAVRKDPGSVRGLPGMQVPMIGRTQELHDLHEAWRQVLKFHENRVVLVTGEAGLGKSRLIREFRNEIDDAIPIFEGQCLAFARSKPFWVLASLLRDILQISELDPSERQRQKLLAFGREHDLPMQQVMPYLLNILGLEQEDSAYSEQVRQLDPTMLQRQTHVAMRQVLLTLADAAPLILILEDLHWVDPASKEWLIYLLQSISEAPILLILISRDFERKTVIRPLVAAIEKRPDCFTDIQLNRLSESETQQLLEQLLRHHSDEQQAANEGMQVLWRHIVQRAEGNPFYIEEIVRMLLDQEALVEQDGSFVTTAKLEESLRQLPGTLKSLILTRFDGLRKEPRAILQKAAALGRSFPLSLLHALHPGDPDETAAHLLELKNRLFLVEEPFNREPGFTFHHALIQEAIYSTLLKRDRRALHGRIAEVIEQGNFYTEDERTEALGYHYVNSNNPARAIPFLIVTAENASRRSAHETAVDYYRRALALMADQPQTSIDEYCRVRLGLGQTLKLRGEFSEASQVLTEVVEKLSGSLDQSPQRLLSLIEALKDLADVRQREGALNDAVDHLNQALSYWDELNGEGDPQLWYALLDRMAWVHFRRSDLDEAAQLASRAVRELEQQETAAPVLLASLYNTLGGTYYQQGSSADAIPFVENSLRLNEMLGYAWGRAVAYSNLGVLYYVQGMWNQAAECYRQADRIRQENGFIAERAVNLRNLGLLNIALGNHEQARTDIERSLQISRHVGDSTGVGSCHIELGYLAHIQGCVDDAMRHIQAAQEVADALGEDHFVLLLLLQAQIHGQTGSLKGGFELANQALEMAVTSNLSEEEMDAYRVLATLHVRTGEYVRAEHLLHQSAELASQRHNPYREGLAQLELGRLYDTQMKERHANRAVLLPKAEDALAAAIENFESLGARHDLRQAHLLRTKIRQQSQHPIGKRGASPHQQSTEGDRNHRGAAPGERRQAAVLWIQTQPAPEMEEAARDDETLLEITRHVMTQVTALAHELGGQVVAQQEGISLLFGTSVPHEDDPERAVRAAWHLRAALKQGGEGCPPVAMRAAVSAGEVVVGVLSVEGSEDFIVTGEPLQQAQRLIQNAPLDSIWTTPEVRQRTEHAFLYRTVPGREHTEVVGVQEPHQARFSRAEISSDFIGRKSILESMIQLAQNLPSQEGGLIWLEGEAGIGKTRLMQEFSDQISDSGVAIWTGSCSSHTLHSPFSLFSTLLNNTFGLTSSDAAQERRAKITQKLRTWSAELEWLHRYVSMLCGVPLTEDEQDRLANLEPNEMRQQIFVALRTLLCEVAKHQPLILLLDDLQWIDPMSADLLLFLSNSVTSAPILFVCALRPEPQQVPEALQKIRTVHPLYNLHVRLESLTPEESQLLLAELMQDRNLPDELAQAVLERSEGNPFFLEELVRSLFAQEEHTANPVWPERAEIQDDELPIPASLKELVHARFHSLPPVLKKVLQYLAVLGRPCDGALLATLCKHREIEPLIQQLHQRGLLTRSNDTRQWMFSHSLTEKIVYGTLLKIQRQRAHKEVAEALEAEWGESAAEHADELAHHFNAADEPQKAISYHVLAAERAAARSANEEALAHFEQATALLSEARGVTEALRWRIAAGLGDVCRFMGRCEEALEVLTNALALTAISVDQKAGIHRRIGQTHQRQGEPEAALNAFEQALLLLRDWSSRAVGLELARTHYGIAWTHFSQGQLEEAKEHCLRSLHHAQEHRSLREQATAENLLGGIHYHLGEWTRAMHHTRRAMEIREEIGYTWGVALSLNNLGVLAISSGEWEKARDYFQRSLVQNREIGNMEGISIAHINLGRLACEQGDLATAEYHFQESYQIAKNLNTAYYATNAHVGSARVHLLQGNLAAAQRVVMECTWEATAIHAQDLLVEAQCVQVEILLEQGELVEAESVAREAVELAREIGTPGPEATAWRLISDIQLQRNDLTRAAQSLQNAHDTLASVTDELEKGRLAVQAGKLAWARGCTDEAEDQMRRAKRIFARLGAHRDLELLPRQFTSRRPSRCRTARR